jgi:hypothetical protein
MALIIFKKIVQTGNAGTDMPHSGQSARPSRTALRRLALQLAVQMPSDAKEARVVLEALEEILDVINEARDTRKPEPLVQLVR